MPSNLSVISFMVRSLKLHWEKKNLSSFFYHQYFFCDFHKILIVLLFTFRSLLHLDFTVICFI